ncbi:MAG: peptidoglycan-binding protein LysM [Hyphomicrobiales bacterium]
MGLFDFIKSAGKALGISSDDETPSADALKEELEAQGLGTEGVEIEVDGDKAIIKGDVADQSIFEKAIVAVGNSLGISKVEASDLTVAAADANDPVFYTVQKGDTLWKISEENYGKGKGGKYNIIFEANKPMLSHPDKIYPGQVLRIPDLESA